MSRKNNKCEMQEENDMCRKLIITNEIFLGSRPICFEAYSLPKGEVVELTEKQIKDAPKGITSDEVYGMKITEAGELELDTENFFVTNMMKKVHTNTLISMVEDDCLANLFYIVIGTATCRWEIFIQHVRSNFKKKNICIQLETGKT